MQESDLEQGVMFAVDTYKELFVNRYQRQPLSQQIGHAVLRGLVRQHGLRPILDLLRTFFATPGDNEWYQKNGHSMEVFAKNIGALNARLGTKEKAVARVENLLISVDSACPKCRALFKLVLKPSEVGVKTHLTVCDNCAKPSLQT